MLALVVMLGTVGLALLACVTFPWDRNRLVVGYAFRRLARFAILLVPFWRFAARPPVPPRLVGPHVVVSNHESHLDAFLISHLPWEMKWLAKRSLFRVPFIGWCMALAGDVAIERGARDSRDRALARCRDYLDRGVSVFLFPEGTRALSNELQPFKLGAFRLALEANVPLLPLAVAGTRAGLQKGAFLFGTCRARLAVGRPIETGALRETYTDADGVVNWHAAAQALASAAREQIVSMRASLRCELGKDNGR